MNGTLDEGRMSRAGSVVTALSGWRVPAIVKHDPEAHAAFTAALVSALAADPDVVGVVLLGSSSGLPPPPDPFSDTTSSW